jgi:hypothetical protein
VRSALQRQPRIPAFGRAPQETREWAGNGLFARSISSPDSQVGNLRAPFAKVSGLVREYSRFAETISGDWVRSRLPPGARRAQPATAGLICQTTAALKRQERRPLNLPSLLVQDSDLGSHRSLLLPENKGHFSPLISFLTKANRFSRAVGPTHIPRKSNSSFRHFDSSLKLQHGNIEVRH